LKQTALTLSSEVESESVNIALYSEEACIPFTQEFYQDNFLQNLHETVLEMRIFFYTQKMTFTNRVT